MHFGDSITLYRENGSAVVVREFRRQPTDTLAEGLVTDDGRIVWCQDEGQGIFFFQDTQEKLSLKPPRSTQS